VDRSTSEANRSVRVDVTASVQRRAGVGRYAEELIRALVSLNGDDDVRLFYTDQQGRSPSPPLDALSCKTLRWSNRRWRLSAVLSLYSHIAMDSVVGEADLFHATDHLLPRLSGMGSVFTLHDLSFLTCPETHLAENRWFLRLMMPAFLRRADAVICISERTRKDALRYYGLDEAKIHVIGEGVDARFKPVMDEERLNDVRARYGLPERFILFVGTLEPRKNLVTLLEALRALRGEGRDEKLVVVGRKGWLHEGIFARIRDLGLEGDVVFPGYLADEDLPALYGAATVFAFPSLYEGFDLPPLEAMACGTPVVCSSAASLPEVCGDAALLVAPTDVTALTAALRRALDDSALREDLRARGLRQASRFDWREAAEKTRAVYASVVDAQRSPTRRSPRPVARR
jgi:glycosyltransferase involved in cell wall biosynthesis